MFGVYKQGNGETKFYYLNFIENTTFPSSNSYSKTCSTIWTYKYNSTWYCKPRIINALFHNESPTNSFRMQTLIRFIPQFAQNWRELRIYPRVKVCSRISWIFIIREYYKIYSNWEMYFFEIAHLMNKCSLTSAALFSRSPSMPLVTYSKCVRPFCCPFCCWI